MVCFTRAYSKRVPHTNCVRPWAAAVLVAAIGGCRRDNVEGVGEEEEASSCIRVRVSAISIARPYGNTCTSLHTLISDGPA